ncbi:MAG: hypothetical protein VCF07_15295, partial [Nitrospinota bacterium]
LKKKTKEKWKNKKSDWKKNGKKRKEIDRRTNLILAQEEWKPSGSGIYLKGSTHILTCTASLLP